MSEENSNFEQQKEQLIRTLATMFDFLGLNGDFRVELRDDNRISVKIASTDAGRVIGRKGQTLESLQLLANRIMFKADNEFPHVMLDIDGYANGEREPRAEGEEEGASPRRHRDSDRRRFHRGEGSRVTREQLEKQAKDAAKEVKRWGEAVKLPEMNAHDRRIIHLTLQDDPEISTESEGEGNFKKVVVSLKKAE